MRFVVFLLLTQISAVVAQAATPGFTQGSQFYATSLQGAVTVSCSTGEIANYTCFGATLDPSSYDYFNGPAEVKAEEVVLVSTKADGSRRERTELYNSKYARSEGAFNLWISTPFQRPLLAMGTNVIDYKLMSVGKIVHQGGFTVTVTRGPSRTCPMTHYNSTDPSDCQSHYTVCQRYFEQYDYCR